MIGIKMQMPKSCDKCKFCIDNGYLTSQCRLNFETVEDLRLNKIDKNCPLIDLGSEDMSFNDLFKKIEDKISVIYDNHFCVNFGDGSIFLSFYDDNKIIISTENDFIKFENIKPFQMWQIIQALVGER